VAATEILLGKAFRLVATVNPAMSETLFQMVIRNGQTSDRQKELDDEHQKEDDHVLKIWNFSTQKPYFLYFGFRKISHKK